MLNKILNHYYLRQAKQAIGKNQPEKCFWFLSQLSPDSFQKQKSFQFHYLRAQAFLHQKKEYDACIALQEQLYYFPNDQKSRNLLVKLKNAAPESQLSDDDDECSQLIRKISNYSLLSEKRLRNLYALGEAVLDKKLSGHFIECGVFQGGSSALLSYLIKKESLNRALYCFDSFTGMPKPTSHDVYIGTKAEYTGWGLGSCSAPKESLYKICEEVGGKEIPKTIEGYFEQTIPSFSKKQESIALLHIDCDWYSSTKIVLDHFYDLVIDGGYIQIDDYGSWSGCKQAVEEFQQKRNIEFKLIPIDETGVWMRKENVVCR
jgi:hypothetical protein